MSSNTAIEWADHTFNPWWGCTKVSPACEHCYAEVMAKRQAKSLFGVEGSIWGPGTPRPISSDARWAEPLKWNKAAAKAGKRPRVFCASMADVFEDRTDLDVPRTRLFNLIGETPHLDWLLLTKRIQAVKGLVPWGDKWPSNVWLGTTVEDQRRLEERLPHLVSIPAKVRFISAEPLLEVIDLRPYLPWLDWVIYGGESGRSAREGNADRFRSVRDQCVEAGVPHFFKQWGTWGEQNGTSKLVKLKSKYEGGRVLDGQTYAALPAPSAKRLNAWSAPKVLST